MGATQDINPFHGCGLICKYLISSHGSLKNAWVLREISRWSLSLFWRKLRIFNIGPLGGLQLIFGWSDSFVETAN